MSSTEEKPTANVRLGPVESGLAVAAPPPRVVIAGFGLPGRSLADVLESAHIPYSVVETNPDVVARCARSGKHMICGDARDEAVLRSAGVGSAQWLAVMMPVEGVVLDVIRAARRAKPTVKILARTSFTSTGMEAVRLGADEVVVAEQVVADAAAEILRRTLEL